MNDWIPFREGEYLVEQGFLMVADMSAVLLEDAVLRVFLDAAGRRQASGVGRVNTLQIVKLLDCSALIDLALDLGGKYKYLLKDPVLRSGKVFSPGLKTTLEFSPKEPWKQIAEKEFKDLRSRLRLLSERPPR